ncbi:uncharacterized protein [Physcomitrium patens]|uniref:uncharacterized protein isoform X4 n=1 Tax=Physcomitrium patens TaxID=3218 RepID=UPI003CCD8CCC
MATPGRNQRRLELHVVFLLLFLFANLSHAVLENSSMVWRYAGEEPSLVASVTSPQEYSSKDYISFLEWRAVVLIQTWRGYLTQKVTQESSADNAIDLVKGPCNSETKKLVSCPVQCFRVDPVCGTDNVTYWSGRSS